MLRRDAPPFPETSGKARAYSLTPAPNWMRWAFSGAACVAGILIMPTFAGAAVVDFEGAAAYSSLSALPGWSQSPAPAPPAGPYGWVTPWARASGSTMAGAIGGYFDAPASTYSATYSTAIPIYNGYAYGGIFMDFGLIDSTNTYPGRDSFSVSVRDNLGSSYVTVNLVPIAQSATPATNTALWQLTYLYRGGVPVTTSVALAENGEYSLSFDFTSTGINFAVNAGVVANTYFGTPTSYNSTTGRIGSTAFTWTKGLGNADFGDNYIVFDNVAVVPEPGTVLLTVLGVLPLFHRRRQVTKIS